MAGDWIKVEVTTPRKEEVWQIADELDIDPDAAFGKLFRVWAWFDSHSEDGNAKSVSKKLLDREVSVTGFCDSMVRVGWMIEKDGMIRLPNFDRHNGKTAKNRALTAKRVAEHKKKTNDKVTKGALPREEKRREEGKAEDISAMFDIFYDAYPLKKSKEPARKAFFKIKPDESLFQLMMKALEEQKMEREVRLDSGQFVPEWKHPSTWLNKKSWEDEVDLSPRSGGNNGSHHGEDAQTQGKRARAEQERELRESQNAGDTRLGPDAGNVR